MKNNNTLKVSLDELYPIIKEKLESGGTVQLPITGTSMLPLLVWGRDSVELIKAKSYNKGDIIFYRRDDGHFVLHRIVGKNDKSYVLCGDNQWVKETGIEDRHIIAVVKSITRNNKKIDVKYKPYVLYSKVWVAILRFRRFILIPMRKIKGLLNK
ncbi:MAG: S24/S26 family peptidase [Clostridia bacterium]|nr:S24/S26 family peptidase [Clostridia bacterium]